MPFFQKSDIKNFRRIKRNMNTEYLVILSGSVYTYLTA